jgi:hypothetical protein
MTPVATSVFDGTDSVGTAIIVGLLCIGMAFCLYFMNGMK